jgi:hypothetical protein
MFDVNKLFSVSVEPNQLLVNMVAHIVLLINESVTSMDVKNVLRSMGFNVNQQEIGNCLRTFYDLNKDHLKMSDNGIYRTYTFNSTLNIHFLNQFPEWSLLKRKANPVEITGIGKFIKEVTGTTTISNEKDRLWVVYDGRINDKDKNYKSITASSRDNARKIYSSKYSVPYFHVRARIHNNPAKV